MINQIQIQKTLNCFSVAAFIVAICIVNGEASAQPPTPYNVDPNSVTVSGISSGADLAHQLHIAHSSGIHGAGLLAASPYYCAKSNLNTAMEYCSRFAKEKMNGVYNGPPNAVYVDSLVAATNTEFDNNRIDDPASIVDDKVYLFSGEEDYLVSQEIMDSVNLYYTKLGVSPANITYLKTVPAGHAMVTADYGNACDTSVSPYINKCPDGDVAGALLQHIYGPLAQPSTASAGQLIEFDQTKFFIAGDSASMDGVGHAYVPKACENGEPCKLHVALHGCNQNDDQIQAQFYTHAGYNEWAEANNIIVLYPQVQQSYAPLNPNGCWDWWGYTDANYHTQFGKQVAAVKGMIDLVVAGGPLPKAEPADPCEAWPIYLRFICRWFY